MEEQKGINLQAEVHLGREFSSEDEARQTLERVFTRANPGMRMRVNEISAIDAEGLAVVRVYIRGKQETTADFAPLATAALYKTLASLPGASAGGRMGDTLRYSLRNDRTVRNVVEDENTDEEVLARARLFRAARAVQLTAAEAAAFTAQTAGARTIQEVAQTVQIPGLGDNDFHGCPSIGTGNDPELSRHKNRIDSTNWNLVTISSIMQLPNPAELNRRIRSSLTQVQRDWIAQFEGIPVQVVGWLADQNPEHEEPCNCNRLDEKDIHLFVVDDRSKPVAQAMVAEVTPRIRHDKPAMVRSNITPLILRKMVRVSGWLMFDQEHIGDIKRKFRGTVWEIHPIVTLEWWSRNKWIALTNQKP